MPRPQVSFFTAGQQFPHNGSYINVNQAYVQYIPPVDVPAHNESTSLPILFVHGGGLTGATWEATPDRRPGWALLASRRPWNRPVYILDTVDSGRSQRCPATLRSDETCEHRTAAEMWERFRIGPSEGFAEGRRVAYEGSQFPVEHFDALNRVQSARRRSKEQDNAEMAGVAAAIKEIGRCQVIIHSNGGGITCGALRRDGEAKLLVEKLVLIEPSLPMDRHVDVSPVKTLVIWGDYLDDRYKRMRGLIEIYKEGLHEPDLWDLPKRLGVKGNTHFPMCDRNSDLIGNMVLDWLSLSKVPSQPFKQPQDSLLELWYTSK